MKMGRRRSAIRKSDLTPAFEAARDAGFDQVSIVVETDDGQKVLITAAHGSDIAKPDMTPLEEWRARRATS